MTLKKTPVTLSDSARVAEESILIVNANVGEPLQEEEEVPKILSNALHRFFLGPDKGPIFVLIALMGIVYTRLTMATAIGSGDFAAFGASILFWWFQEHLLHERLLHSNFDWLGKHIHQEHHEKPYYHISIDPSWLMVSWLGVASVMFRLVLPVHVATSAIFGYALAGLMYEWTHYIVHTRVKPTNSFLKRVRDNHIKHHLVDSRYWFAFSVPAVDDLLGTNPSMHQVRSERKKEAVNRAGVQKPF
jgi:hypothetical protein